MPIAPELATQEPLRQRVAPHCLHFAAVLTQLRRNRGESRRGVEVLLAPASEPTRAAEQPVLAQCSERIGRRTGAEQHIEIADCVAPTPTRAARHTLL